MLPTAIAARAIADFTSLNAAFTIFACGSSSSPDRGLRGDCDYAPKPEMRTMYWWVSCA